MSGISPATATLILWGVVTALLTALLISMKEDDQLFLNSAASNLEKEQQQVRKRLGQLAPYAKILGATSGLLPVERILEWKMSKLQAPSISSAAARRG